MHHVADDATNQASTVTPYKSAMTGELHPIHAESACYPKTNKMFVVLDKLDALESWNEDPASDEEDVMNEKIRKVQEAGGPKGWAGPFIKVTSRGDFVTVEEYIDAVFPWLVSLRSEYIQELSNEQGADVDHDLELWLNPIEVDHLWLIEPGNHRFNGQKWDTAAIIATKMIRDSEDVTLGTDGSNTASSTSN